MFSDEELELIDEVMAYFVEHDADSYPEIRNGRSILAKIDKHLNGGE